MARALAVCVGVYVAPHALAPHTHTYIEAHCGRSANQKSLWFDCAPMRQCTSHTNNNWKNLRLTLTLPLSLSTQQNRCSLHTSVSAQMWTSVRRLIQYLKEYTQRFCAGTQIHTHTHTQPHCCGVIYSFAFARSLSRQAGAAENSVGAIEIQSVFRSVALRCINSKERNAKQMFRQRNYSLIGCEQMQW